MSLDELMEYLLTKEPTRDFQRVFHGRGEAYGAFKYLSIDSIDGILSVTLFEEDEQGLIDMLTSFAKTKNYKAVVLQRRHLKDTPNEVIFGELKDELVAYENGMKFKLNLLSNQNSLFFGDMKNGREFVRENAKDKHILNLFSYTCAFSVAAKLGGAKSVVNVDMSKSSLSVGKANHALNSIDAKGVSFLPYNILKSISGIKKKGPFDMVIIDPPSYQKGSFEAKKDYVKIVKRLHELLSEDALVLACLNAPEIGSNFLLDMFEVNGFDFSHKVANPLEYPSINEEKSLKTMVFKVKKC